MEILEFGDRSKRKILLIHGFQSPYRVWQPYIERYRKDFHIIVPILPGHNPNQKEDFVSFSETAEEIEDFCIAHCGENAYAVYGMSMGGVVAAALWQNGRLHIEKVIFDGSPLVPPNGLMKKMMISFYLNVTHKSQKREPKTLKQARSIAPEEHMEDFLQVLDNMSDRTIVNCIAEIGAFRLTESAETKNTKIYYFHGTALNETLAKKSAKALSKRYPDAAIKRFRGKGHCEISLFYPKQMIEELDRILLKTE